MLVATILKSKKEKGVDLFYNKDHFWKKKVFILINLPCFLDNFVQIAVDDTF